MKVLLRVVTSAVLFASLLAGAEPASAAFPGHNGKIAFATSRDGHLEVYVMNADGSGQTNLTNDPAEDFDPAWSPDGTKIAFQSDRDGNEEVYVMNADGSEQTNLTNNASNEGDPAWSPDGTKIAFTTFRDGNLEIYVMNADGSAQTNLTSDAAADGLPAWSPDGTKIAFTSNRGGDNDVYVMNADGSAQTNLTSDAAPDGATAWSPDGTKIAFTSNHEIYVMNADGSARTNLTNNDNTFDDWAAWSPDGSKIAYTTIRSEGGFEIFAMNADGSGKTNLTNHPGFDLGPDWQPATAADLAVLDVDLATLDGAGLGDLLAGQLFEFDAPLTLHNFGDVADDFAQFPVDARVSRTIDVPGGVSAFVRVTADEAPATVSVDDGLNPVVAINQPAGTVTEVEGPASISVGFDASALEAGADRVVSTTFGVRCDQPGTHEIGVRADIFPTEAHVVDPQPANNGLEVGRAIECVMPMQINIRPGNSHNFVNPNANQVVPVATLTTTAGEYGLPLAFDASTVDHSTVRFGTLQSLNDGNGAMPSPNLPFIQDSFEMDDTTKDGDLDLVLRFPGSGAGFDDSTTSACLVGTYFDEDANLRTFLGCDAVQIQ
ncbi:MAG: DPP IV N-terminal domain-containing protein [Actinomycetota bacterium]|nr:DPP IV N-terminal domain-containing protein [Actinomycetota bacterium]